MIGKILLLALVAWLAWRWFVRPLVQRGAAPTAPPPSASGEPSPGASPVKAIELVQCPTCQRWNPLGSRCADAGGATLPSRTISLALNSFP